jgi:xanthine dehydrogenase FAD-binding subunit
MLTCDQYHMPETLKEALSLWTNAPSGSRLLAGATDILPWAREGRAGDVHLPLIVDISRVQEFGGYKIGGGKVRLGANVPYQQFLTDEALRKNLPCMPYCAIWFADDQIRHQATLVGNVVNASPAADGTPPVLAMNGSIELARISGDEVVSRSMPVSDFVKGPGNTDLQPDEIVTSITCDALEGYGGSFEKVGQRRSLVISSVCVAALVKTDAEGKIFEDVRLALGGVGPVPARLQDIEERLIGREISTSLISHASKIAANRVASRTRQEYRRNVVQGFVAAAIADALSDCGHPLADEPRKEAANV